MRTSRAARPVAVFGADEQPSSGCARDLRRRDLPALGAAADATGEGDVHVLFVIDPVLWDRCGPVRRGWLAASIRAAAASYDGRLTVRVGDPATTVAAFAAEVGAGSVHVSAETTPYGARARRTAGADGSPSRDRVGRHRFAVRRRAGAGADPGGRRRTGCSRRSPGPGASTAGPSPAPTPRGLASVTTGSDEPRRDAAGAAARRRARSTSRPPGEEAALRRWRAFRDEHLGDYADDRDRPDRPRHVAALAVPQGRRDPPAHDPGRPRRRSTAGRAGVRRRAGLARVLRRRALHATRLGLARPAPALRAMAYDDPTDAVDGVAEGTHRLPDRRRRDAPAAARRAGCTTGSG